MSDTPSDRQLFNRWGKGDTAARDLLYERHFDALHSLFDRLFKAGYPNEAEELIRTTFLTCLRMRDSFWPDESFCRQLFAIARNRYIDVLRKRRHDGVVDPEPGEPDGTENAPDELN